MKDQISVKTCAIWLLGRLGRQSLSIQFVDVEVPQLVRIMKKEN